MTMFVRAIEGFLGRVIILLGLTLIVLYVAYFGAQEVSQWDFSNQIEGLWFQIKATALAVMQWVDARYAAILNLVG